VAWAGARPGLKHHGAVLWGCGPGAVGACPFAAPPAGPAGPARPVFPVFSPMPPFPRAGPPVTLPLGDSHAALLADPNRLLAGLQAALEPAACRTLSPPHLSGLPISLSKDSGLTNVNHYLKLELERCQILSVLHYAKLLRRLPVALAQLIFAAQEFSACPVADRVHFFDLILPMLLSIVGVVLFILLFIWSRRSLFLIILDCLIQMVQSSTASRSRCSACVLLECIPCFCPFQA
jgi:hypothetical protein